MVHLNCFPPRAAGVNFWFFIAVPFGGGCWYKAKCEMLLRKIDSEMNVQNCGSSAKWRRWWHASRLTATVVVMDSLHRFSKRWHVADVKKHCRRRPGNYNCPRNSANIACITFMSTRSLLLFRRSRQRQLPRTAAVATHPHRRFRSDDTLSTSKSSLEMTRQP